MRFILKITLACMLLITSGANAATTYTVDFSDATIIDESFFLVQSKGFDFTSSFVATGAAAEMVIASGDDFGLSGTAVVFCPGNCDLTMQRTDGTAFAIHSADFLSVTSLISEPYVITGHLVGGGTISLNSVISGDPNTALFDSGWTNLESVVFGIGIDSVNSFGTYVDTISVTAVPIPAAVWLFGSALGLVGWMRRKPAH